jgi:hypothetical protein
MSVKQLDKHELQLELDFLSNVNEQKLEQHNNQNILSSLFISMVNHEQERGRLVKNWSKAEDEEAVIRKHIEKIEKEIQRVYQSREKSFKETKYQGETYKHLTSRISELNDQKLSLENSLRKIELNISAKKETQQEPDNLMLCNYYLSSITHTLQKCKTATGEDEEHYRNQLSKTFNQAMRCLKDPKDKTYFLMCVQEKQKNIGVEIIDKNNVDLDKKTKMSTSPI